MVHKSNKKLGFTVIEVIIASMVLALTMGAAYKIFSGTSMGFQRSTKVLAMQNEMRNGLTFIREEMQRASYRSEIKVNGSEIEENGYEFHLCNETDIDGSTNKILAKWTICKPFKRDNSGAVYECTLRISDRKILYTKTEKETKGSSEPETLYNDKVVMTQVGKIKFSTEEFTTGTSNQGVQVNIETFAYNSTKGQPDLNVYAQTGAKIEEKLVKGF